MTADAEEEIAQLHADQTVLETRIARLEELLRGAQVAASGPAGVVQIGCVVELEHVRGGKLAAYRVTGSGGSAGGSLLRALASRASGIGPSRR